MRGPGWADLDLALDERFLARQRRQLVAKTGTGNRVAVAVVEPHSNELVDVFVRLRRLIDDDDIIGVNVD